MSGTAKKGGYGASPHFGLDGRAGEIIYQRCDHAVLTKLCRANQRYCCYSRTRSKPMPTQVLPIED